jgi:excisionase family DNA binding protein
MSIREKYVRVREASQILGVSLNTVRAWGATGKIPEHRLPNGFRAYKREDLDRLLKEIESSATARSGKE